MANLFNFFSSSGIKKVVRIFCPEYQRKFLSVRIENIRDRIHDPHTSNQIDAAALRNLLRGAPSPVTEKQISLKQQLAEAFQIHVEYSWQKWLQ